MSDSCKLTLVLDLKRLLYNLNCDFKVLRIYKMQLSSFQRKTDVRKK